MYNIYQLAYRVRSIKNKISYTQISQITDTYEHNNRFQFLQQKIRSKEIFLTFNGVQRQVSDACI